MRLGVRWRAGEPPHRSVPAELHAAIAEQELAHPEAESWTLTWLEGEPRCALDDIVVLGPSGVESPPASSTRGELEDDDWLE